MEKLSQIETKIKYFHTLFMQIDDTDDVIICNPFIRRDFHEDGSVSKYYGVEMTRKNFKRLRKACKKA